jgi:hypothetical protein
MPEWDDKKTYTEIRYRVNDPKKYDEIKRSTITDGVVMLYGRLKGTEDWEIQALRFSKEDFTLTEAKKWLKDHPDMLKDELMGKTWSLDGLTGALRLLRLPRLQGQEAGGYSAWGIPPGLTLGIDQMTCELDTSRIKETDEMMTIPAVFTKEGVQNKGYKPKDEVKRAAPFANGIPFVLDHLDNWDLDKWLDFARFRGYTSGAHYVEDGAKISGEVNIYKTDKNKDMLKAIKDGKKRDVSIEYLFSKDDKAGEFNGNKYDYTERDIYILALANVDKGACSIEDGCGLGMNREGKKGEKPMEENENQAGIDSIGDLSLEALADKNKPVAELTKAYESLEADHKKLDDEHNKLVEDNKTVVAERDAYKTEKDEAEKKEKDALTKELIEKDSKRKEDYEKGEMSLDELKERLELVNDLTNSASGDKQLKGAGGDGKPDSGGPTKWDSNEKKWVN